jgi:hypothetical protein
MSSLVRVAGVPAREFFERHARAGRIGLVGGRSLVDRAIGRAQRPIAAECRSSRWSHAFLFEGRRIDGAHWVVESDLDLHRKHVRLGVQENRIDKYHGDAFACALVLDVGLRDAEVERVLAAALELVAARTRYSLRELAGTLLAMHTREKRRAVRKGPQRNRLARERSFFCSAMVSHVFASQGIELVPGLDPKLTTTEDLACSPRVRAAWLLEDASRER